MVSVITWQTIYLNGIIHSFDLAKANMHVAEEKSVTHKTQNTRRAFLCVTDKRDNCSTYFLPDTRCIINMSAIFNLFLSDTFLTYIIHSGFISGYQNRYGDNLKPPTNVYHRMTA